MKTAAQSTAATVTIKFNAAYAASIAARDASLAAIEFSPAFVRAAVADISPQRPEDPAFEAIVEIHAAHDRRAAALRAARDAHQRDVGR